MVWQPSPHYLDQWRAAKRWVEYRSCRAPSPCAPQTWSCLRTPSVQKNIYILNIYCPLKPIKKLGRRVFAGKK